MKRKAQSAALLLVGLLVAFLLFWDPLDDRPDTTPSDDSAPAPKNAPPPLLGSEAAAEPTKKAAEETQPPPTPSEPEPGEVNKGTVVRVTGAEGEVVTQAFVRLVRDADGQPGNGRANIISEHRATLPLSVPRLDATTWIEVIRPRDAQGKDLPLASGWGGPFDAGESAVVVVLPSGRVLAGRVIDAGGHPLANARVEAYFDADEGRRRVLHGHAVSAADGTFRIGRLRRGTYHLEVWPRGPHGAPPPVAAEAGTEDLELRTLPGFAARLIVVDGAGAPVPKARLAISTSVSRGKGFSTSFNLSEGMTDDAGLLVLDGLDPKRTYALRVDPPYQRKDLIEIDERGWKPQHQTFTLRRGVEVTGHATYPDGKPFPFASLTVSPAGMGLVSVNGSSRKDGTFVIKGVPEGNIQIRAWRREKDGMEWLATGVKAKAPSTGVRIVMQADPVGTFTVRFGAPGGPAEGAIVRLSEIKDGKAVHGSTGSVRRGVATLRRVRMKRTYVLYACSRDKGLCALVRDILPGKGAIDLVLVAAHTIRGRVDAPDGATDLTVYARGFGVTTGEQVGPGGDFVLNGLPRGTYTVGAIAKLGGRSLHKAVEAKTGDSIDITLE